MRSSSKVCALLLVASVAGAAGERITVASEATVAGEIVRLGDVAALEGPAAVAVAALPLGPAPGAGESRTLDGAHILDAVRRAGVDLAAVTYNIPARVNVRRATQEVQEAEVRRALEQFLGEALGTGAADAVLRSVELPGPIRIPAGPYTMRVIPPPGRPVLGRVRVQLELMVDDRPVKTVWVTADVGLYGPVVVATRAVQRGDTVVATDVTVERRELSDAGHGVIGASADVVGRVARAPLVPWAAVHRDQVVTAADVHRGDVVLLVAERRGLRITAAGEVREDAGRGQQVHVLNRASRKDLVGRVVDANTVVVDF